MSFNEYNRLRVVASEPQMAHCVMFSSKKQCLRDDWKRQWRNMRLSANRRVLTKISRRDDRLPDRQFRWKQAGILNTRDVLMRMPAIIGKPAMHQAFLETINVFLRICGNLSRVLNTIIQRTKKKTPDGRNFAIIYLDTRLYP